MTSAPPTSQIRDRIRELRRVPASELRANPANWRTHPPEQARALQAMLERIGFADALLARETDDGLELIDGHLRADLQPDALVPVLVLDVDADEALLLLATLDPLAAMATTDDAQLAALLGEVTIDQADLEAHLVSFMAGNGATGQTDPDDLPSPPAEPVTQLGDLWLMGQHRLLCGDALDPASVARLLAGCVPDIACCDPPYGVSVVKPNGQIHGDTTGSIGGAKGRRSGKVIPQGVYAPIIGDETTDTAVGGYQVAVDLGVPVLVFWGGNYYADRLPASRCWLVWEKKTDSSTFADAELAWTNQDRVVKVFQHHWAGMLRASEKDEDRIHPTQKPIALAEWVIQTLAPDAGAVLDLFIGSGWTLLASERLGKACYGMELAPAYCDVIVARYEAFTGEKAVLADG